MGQPVSWVRIPPSPNFKNPLYSGFLFYAKIFVGLFLNKEISINIKLIVAKYLKPVILIVK